MLPIVYQDEHFVAVHKPSGLLVHRSQIDRHETRFALQMVRDQLGKRVYSVHRLDKGTSGILLFGLNEASGRALSKQFEAGEVGKRYIAIVRGWPAAQGEIDHPLTRWCDDHETALEVPDAPPQEALSRFKRLATVELPHTVDRYPTSRYALLELEPVTGRRHQLRRHLKHISHPIIGDATYGKGRHNRLFTSLFGTARLLLACTHLNLRHPVTGETMNLVAPVSEDFAQVCGALGWELAAL